MEKLLLVDGNNLLFQMFYGMPARIVNEQGKAIQGTLGFVGALLKILRMTCATHVAVLFDGEYVSQRTQIDEAYKGNREDYTQMPEEDTPFSQLPDIFKALDYMGIRYQETTTCEADDWIAGYAKQYGDQMDVIIVSQDSDFFQLITERVQVLRYRGKNTIIWDPDFLNEKLGILPEQYAAYKSLTGDSADNIRGIEKIGPKTAAALMRQFGDLETLIACAEQIAKPSVRTSVAQSIERIKTNYRLIHLEGCEVLPFPVEELVYRDTGVTTTEVMKHI